MSNPCGINQRWTDGTEGGIRLKYMYWVDYMKNSTRFLRIVQLSPVFFFILSFLTHVTMYYIVGLIGLFLSWFLLFITIKSDDVDFKRWLRKKYPSQYKRRGQMKILDVIIFCLVMILFAPFLIVLGLKGVRDFFKPVKVP